MRMRWMLAGVMVAVGLGVVAPGSAMAAEVCTGEAACTSACDGGNAVACTALGDILGQGQGRDPDHAAALKRYLQACDGTTDRPATDPLGCHGAAALYETGWLFEVEKDTYMASSYRETALATGITRCAEGGPDGGRGCYAAAKTTRFNLDRSPEDYKYEGATEVAAYLEQLERACNLGQLDACNDQRNLWGLVNNGLLDSDKASAASGPATKKLVEFCMAGQAAACAGVSYEILQDPKERKALLAALEARCKAGAADACLLRAGTNFEAAGENSLATDPAVVEFFRVLRDVCVRTRNAMCAELGTAFVSIEIKPMLDKWDQWDPAFGLKVLKFQCNAGFERACEFLGRTLAPAESGDTSARAVPADEAGMKAAAERACKLTPPLSDDATYNECAICDKHEDLGECQLRKAYKSSRNCQNGTLEACEDLGDRYADGLGVAKDPERAAQSFKNACDGSVKSSCAKLDALCRDNEGMSEDMCAPSLLHTDVFYEAEWQFRQTQTATLQSGKKPEPSAVGTVTMADGGGGGGGAGVSMSRGSLDADLVVSIVLDRARQAAMRVVVDELSDRMGQAGIRTYMRDLLEQGATLMADSTNLRRDTLHDLGMTLVRAFAASNLVRTVLGTPDALKRAKILGPVIATWKAEWISREAGRLTPELEAYLADSAYWALGGQPLLSGTNSATAPAPACPFTDARKELCTVLGKRDQVTLALHVDGVLAALNMARALGTEGGIDVRRLIEAVAQSKAIVDFAATPGLNLYAWQNRIVDDQRYRLTSLRDRLGNLVRLIDPETYSEKGPADVYALSYLAGSVREFLQGDGRALVGESLDGDLYALLNMSEGVSSGGAFGAQNTPEVLAATRKDALAAIARLGDTWRKGAIANVEAARARIDLILGKLAELGRGLTSITATLKYHQPQGNDASVHLRIDKVPLADLDVLIDAFRPLIKTLDEVDTGMRDLLPGTDLRGVRFARSSAVRLLGFLDLMSRVARAGGINQTVRDVVDTLQLLGRYKKGEFTAPLYDMLQPVLEFIVTRTPMPLEQLFAIVGRVRLDGLVTSLALGDSPCAKEDRAECWVFKLAYSLQEAITRDGNSIKIDGAEVAKRLADFGDDFQRRNKGRWYLHLTVGAGMMRTEPPGGGGMRMAPMIAEQIGFGYATPAFWKDRLTLKAGLAGSGLLYRAVLDNAESDAVIGSAFLALDVYDVIEIYGAANVLAYPPADGADATLKTGFSAGLSVPLSAYLEKL